MVYVTRRFQLSGSPIISSVLVSILITSLGEERACLYASFVCLFCMRCFLSFCSCSWCNGLAAVCDRGIPWTFHLTV